LKLFPKLFQVNTDHKAGQLITKHVQVRARQCRNQVSARQRTNQHITTITNKNSSKCHCNI